MHPEKCDLYEKICIVIETMQILYNTDLSPKYIGPVVDYLTRTLRA